MDSPGARQGHTASIVGTSLFILGGVTLLGKECEPSLHSLSLVGGGASSWSEASGTCHFSEVDGRPLPEKLRRQRHAAAVVGDEIFVFGGYSRERRKEWCGECPYLDELLVLRPNVTEGTFTCKDLTHEVQPWVPPLDQDKRPFFGTDERPYGRFGHSFDAVTVGGSEMLVLFGGMSYNYAEKNGEPEKQGDVFYRNDLWSLTAPQSSNWRWTRLDIGGPDPETGPSLRPSPRMGHATAVFGSGKLVLHGGLSVYTDLGRGVDTVVRQRHVEPFNDVWALSFDAVSKEHSWTELSPAGDRLKLRGRAWHTLTLVGSSVLLVGGMSVVRVSDIPSVDANAVPVDFSRFPRGSSNEEDIIVDVKPEMYELRGL